MNVRGYLERLGEGNVSNLQIVARMAVLVVQAVLVVAAVWGFVVLVSCL